MKIDELCQQEYNASRVFITFEKEEMQKTVLTEKTVPIGRPGLLDKTYRLHGQAEEPLGIIWNNYYNPFLVTACLLYIVFVLSFLTGLAKNNINPYL